MHKAHSLDSILAFCPAFCLFLYFFYFLEAHKVHTHCLILDLSFPHLAHPQKSFLPSNDPTLFWRRTRHTIIDKYLPYQFLTSFQRRTRHTIIDEYLPYQFLTSFQRRTRRTHKTLPCPLFFLTSFQRHTRRTHKGVIAVRLVRL